jgi:ankyrin repeat protein
MRFNDMNILDSNRKYFDIVIDRGSYHVIDTDEKPHMFGCAHKILAKLQHVIDKHLKYSPLHENDPYAKLSNEERLVLYHSKCIYIIENYKDKIPLRMRDISMVQNSVEKLEFVQRRIAYKIKPPQPTIPGIHKDIFLQILHYLEPHDLGSLACTSPIFLPAIKLEIMNIAKKFGYFGNYDGKALWYLQDLYGDIKVFSFEFLNIEFGITSNKYRSLCHLNRLPNHILFSFLSEYDYKCYLHLYKAIRPLGNKDSFEIQSDEVREKGNRALIKFSKEKASKVVQTLIHRGVDVNIKDHDGYSPLHLAALHGCVDNVEVLVAAGAVIDEPVDGNMTPLLLACSAIYPKVSIVKLLLKSGANPNKCSNEGLYPLHYAANNYQCEIVLALLSSGAQVNQLDHFGKYPIDYSGREKENRLRKNFLNAGAYEI